MRSPNYDKYPATRTEGALFHGWDAIRDALEATDVFNGLIGTLVMNSETHNPVMACEVFEFQTNEAGEHIKVPIKTVDAVTD